MKKGDSHTMAKYQNTTFKSVKEAITYKLNFENTYGFKPESPIVKVTSSVDSIPKGLIIEATDETENSYIINPIYGFGYYVLLPKQICEKVC